MSKESVKKALDNYLSKKIEEDKPKDIKKNAKPEKETEKECLKWLRHNNFNVSVVESKAVYSVLAGEYTSGQTEKGFSDLVGNDAFGRACYIELKAKGRRANLSPAQYVFLKTRVESNCFAVVVDSSYFLKDIYTEWSKLMDRKQFRLAQRTLLSALPMPAKMKDDGKDLF